MGRSRVFISSNTFGKAFLAKAWEARGELQKYERRGFAQYFYIIITGHIETVIMSCIKARLKIIMSVQWNKAGLYELELNNEIQSHSLEPITSSIKQIASSTLNEVENAPLSKLVQLYNKVFPENINLVIGSESKKDLDALAVLRNIFAHGRDIFVEFEGEDPAEFKGILDGNPLKNPAQRLQAAGIITNFDITGQNHDSFTSIFFSDEAMLYFYNVVREVESKLKLNNQFVPENMMYHIQELPEIQS
ncbi:MAG: hypothetical protein AB2731_10150 [Candidatus Thiodiazotropha sp.]